MPESQTNCVPYESMIEEGQEEPCVASTDHKLQSESSHEVVPKYPSKISASRLRPHPKNAEIMRRATQEEDLELEASIQTYEVQTPLLVTDESCASGYGVVLRGNRRWYFAVARGLDIPVVWASGLSAVQEEDQIAQGNALDQIGRRLTEADLAQAENYIWRREERGAGFRADLAAQNGQTSGEVARGSSVRKLVAAAVMRPESQVRSRHAIYYDPVSPTVLKDAVTSKKVSLSRAYQFVVEARQAFKVPANSRTTLPEDGIEVPEDAAIAEARADIAVKVEKLLGVKAPKAKAAPKPPKVLDVAKVKLAGGTQKVSLGTRSILAIPRGDHVELRESFDSVPVAIGGPQEDRPLTLASSLQAVNDVLEKLPPEFLKGMSFHETEATDPRLFHEAEITFDGYPDLQQGKIRLTWWHRERDWWADTSRSTAAKSPPDYPAIHIEGAASGKDTLVYLGGAHPYSTVRALKAFLLEVICFELGPSYGVRSLGQSWVDRNGVEIPFARRRTQRLWDPATPQSINCPVRVAPFSEVEQYEIPNPGEERLPPFYLYIDMGESTGNAPPRRVYNLPTSSLVYPILEGHESVRSMYGLPLHEAAIIARALGFAVLSPNHFANRPQAELAHAWFLLMYGMRESSGSHITMYAAIGWLDASGSTSDVMSVLELGSLVQRDPDIFGPSSQYGVLHPISAVRAERGVYPAQLLIDKRFLNEPDPRLMELIPADLVPDEVLSLDSTAPS